MKISKRRIRHIIKENTAPAPMRSRATPLVRQAVENSRQQERLQEYTSPIRRQAMILSDLDSAIKNVEETADNMYGLEDPGEPGVDMGTEMAEDLKLAVEMLNDAFKRIESLFQELD